MAVGGLDFVADVRFSNQSLRSARRQAQSVFNDITIGSRGFNKFDNALGRITGRASEFNKSMDAATARVFAFGATAAVINTVRQSFQALLNSTIEVEKRLVEINSIFGASTSEFAKFRKEIFQVAKNTEQSFDVVATGAAELARQGLSVEETAKRLNASLILTRVTGLDSAKAVEALTAAINGFSSTSLTASEIVNKFVAVDTAFAVSSKDLAEGFARAGSTAEDAGLSFDELLALITTVQQRTARGGAVIGNAFKSIFPRITRETSINQLKSLGVEIDASQNGIDKLKALADALNNTADPLVANKIQEIAGGLRQINIVSSALKDLRSETSLFGKAVQTSQNATNEAFEKNEQLNKTLSSQINALVIGMTNLGSKIGNITLSPILKDVTDLANSLTNALSGNLATEAGNNFAKFLFEGIGQFIKGPGILLFAGAFLNIFKIVTKFAIQGFKDLTKLSGAQERVRNIESGIVDLLQRDSNLRTKIASSTLSNAQKQELVLRAIQRENTLLKEQQALVTSIATTARAAGVANFGLTSGFTKKGGKRFAGGYTPIDGLVEILEAKSLGAKGKVKPKLGKGKIKGQKFLMNDQEIEIPNFGKNGDSLVIPRYADGNLSVPLGKIFEKELEEARIRATPLPSLKEFEKEFVEKPLGIAGKKASKPPLRAGRTTFSQDEFNKAFPEAAGFRDKPKVNLQNKPYQVKLLKKKRNFRVGGDNVNLLNQARERERVRQALSSGASAEELLTPIDPDSRTANQKPTSQSITRKKGLKLPKIPKGAGLTAAFAGSFLVPEIINQSTKDSRKEVERFTITLQELETQLSEVDKETRPDLYDRLSKSIKNTRRDLEKSERNFEKISDSSSKISSALTTLLVLPSLVGGKGTAGIGLSAAGIAIGREGGTNLTDSILESGGGAREAFSDLGGLKQLVSTLKSDASILEKGKSIFLASSPLAIVGRIGAAIGLAAGEKSLESDESILNTLIKNQQKRANIRSKKPSGFRIPEFQELKTFSFSGLSDEFKRQDLSENRKGLAEFELRKVIEDSISGLSAGRKTGASAGFDKFISQIKDETSSKKIEQSFSKLTPLFRSLLQGGISEAKIQEISESLTESAVIFREENSKNIEKQRKLNEDFLKGLEESLESNLSKLDLDPSKIVSDLSSSRGIGETNSILEELGISKSARLKAATSQKQTSQFGRAVISGAGTEFNDFFGRLSPETKNRKLSGREREFFENIISNIGLRDLGAQAGRASFGARTSNGRVITGSGAQGISSRISGLDNFEVKTIQDVANFISSLKSGISEVNRGVGGTEEQRRQQRNISIRGATAIEKLEAGALGLGSSLDDSQLKLESEQRKEFNEEIQKTYIVERKTREDNIELIKKTAEEEAIRRKEAYERINQAIITQAEKIERISIPGQSGRPIAEPE